ncbi:MAG: YbaB/EbfC family nucleoid-associated protein [Vulcanimicrobiota bacterium]
MQRQMLRKMQKQMQKSIAKMQEDLNSMEVEGVASNGVVTLKLNGQHELLSVKIDPSVVDPEEVDMLEDLIVVAYRDATTKLQNQQMEAMSKLTGGMNIPPELMGF